MGDVLIWGIFRKSVIEPGVFGMRRDLAEIERLVREELPTVLDYLEQQLPREGFLHGGAGIADISVVVFFRNLGFARQRAVLRAAAALLTTQALNIPRGQGAAQRPRSRAIRNQVAQFAAFSVP